MYQSECVLDCHFVRGICLIKKYIVHIVYRKFEMDFVPYIFCVIILYIYILFTEFLYTLPVKTTTLSNI